MKSRARNRASLRGQETIHLPMPPLRRQARRRGPAKPAAVPAPDTAAPRPFPETPNGRFDHSCDDAMVLDEVELLDEGFDDLVEDWGTLAARSGSNATLQGRWAFWDPDMAE